MLALFLLRLQQATADRSQRLLRSALFSDIDAGANIALERTARFVSRHPVVADPAIHAIVSPEAIFHLERLSLIKANVIYVEAVRAVVRMYALCPSGAKLLFQPSAGKSEPRSIEVSALLVDAGRPDHHRRRVRDRAEAPFRFDNGLDSLLAIGDVLGRSAQLNHIVGSVANDHSTHHHPAAPAVGSNGFQIELEGSAGRQRISCRSGEPFPSRRREE